MTLIVSTVEPVIPAQEDLCTIQAAIRQKCQTFTLNGHTAILSTHTVILSAAKNLRRRETNGQISKAYTPLRLSRSGRPLHSLGVNSPEAPHCHSERSEESPSQGDKRTYKQDVPPPPSFRPPCPSARFAHLPVPHLRHSRAGGNPGAWPQREALIHRSSRCRDISCCV